MDRQNEYQQKLGSEQAHHEMPEADVCQKATETEISANLRAHVTCKGLCSLCISLFRSFFSCLLLTRVMRPVTRTNTSMFSKHNALSLILGDSLCRSWAWRDTFFCEAWTPVTSICGARKTLTYVLTYLDVFAEKVNVLRSRSHTCKISRLLRTSKSLFMK